MAFETFLMGIFIFIGIFFALSLVGGVIALFMFRSLWKDHKKFNDKFFKG